MSLRGLGKGGSPSPGTSTTTATTPTGPVTTPATAPATTPATAGGVPTPTNVPTGTRPIPVSTTGVAGGALGLRIGAAPQADIPAHFKGNVTFEGPWKVKASALEDQYSGVKADKFGTTDVQLPGGGTYNVRDYHYDLGGGKVGMRLIPVNDSGNVTTPDGKTVGGSKIMDDFLRQQMGLGENDPIYALVAYIHPEGHSGKLEDLAKSPLFKGEGGNTHLGAYTGNGRTTNSPEGYHGNQWGLHDDGHGYPANVQVVSLQGVPQATLNQNAIIVDTLLNKGVEFPSNYKNDWYITTDLKTTLEFYKRWVRDDPELKSNPKWHTYCAEHKTIVTNVMLNVPHNEKAFKEIWGDTDGAKLFSEVKAKFKEISGKDMPETSFEPLYQKEGIRKPAEEVGFGKGLAWPAETTVDILDDFLNVYASFNDVGGVVVNAMMAGFLDTIKERTGATDAQYMGLALPFMNKVMVAEAMTQNIANPADLQKFIQQNTAALYVAFGGKKEDFAPGGTLDPAKMGLAQNAMKGVEASGPAIIARHGLSRPEARKWLNENLDAELEKARKTPLGDPNKPQFFSPPNITHRVATGIHEHSSFVSIKTVATAIDTADVELK